MPSLVALAPIHSASGKCHTRRAYSGSWRSVAVPDHIELDADESDAVIKCLVRAAEVGEDTGNLDLSAMAEHLVDLIIEKWLNGGTNDAGRF
ncbi:MAG: hypothetical protein ACRDZ3_18165 [Acidimicrobiia bacterium]